MLDLPSTHDPNKIALKIKDLQPTAAGLTHHDIFIRQKTDATGTIHLTISLSLWPKLKQELAISIKHLNAMVVEISDNDISPWIARDWRRVAKLPITCSIWTKSTGRLVTHFAVITTIKTCDKPEKKKKMKREKGVGEKNQTKKETKKKNWPLEGEDPGVDGGRAALIGADGTGWVEGRTGCVNADEDCWNSLLFSNWISAACAAFCCWAAASCCCEAVSCVAWAVSCVAWVVSCVSLGCQLCILGSKLLLQCLNYSIQANNQLATTSKSKLKNK